MRAPLSSAQVQAAIRYNSADPATITLMPTLSAVFGFRPTLGLVEAIADWQWSRGLVADGQCGLATRAKLGAQGYLVGVNCESLWPSDALRGDQHFAALANHLDVDTSVPSLVALRGCYPYAQQTHRLVHAPVDDDAFVLYLPRQSPIVFPGSTHAYQLTSSESPDVGGPKGKPDGVGDVGSIRPGQYRLVRLPGAVPPMFQLRLPLKNGMSQSADDRIPAFRDTNHDGVISEAEAEASVNATRGQEVSPGVGMWADGVLLHPDFRTMKPGAGRPFSSIACQTTSLENVTRLYAVGTDLAYYLFNAADAARAVAPTLPPPPEGMA